MKNKSKYDYRGWNDPRLKPPIEKVYDWRKMYNDLKEEKDEELVMVKRIARILLEEIKAGSYGINEFNNCFDVVSKTKERIEEARKKGARRVACLTEEIERLRKALMKEAEKNVKLKKKEMNIGERRKTVDEIIQDQLIEKGLMNDYRLEK